MVTDEIRSFLARCVGSYLLDRYSYIFKMVVATIGASGGKRWNTDGITSNRSLRVY